MRKGAVAKAPEKDIVLIAGSEGNGIALEIEGTSIPIDHNALLESLNVGHAVAIILAAVVIWKNIGRIF